MTIIMMVMIVIVLLTMDISRENDLPGLNVTYEEVAEEMHVIQQALSKSLPGHRSWITHEFCGYYLKLFS